jgi:chaperonin cofactor prefoldin
VCLCSDPALVQKAKELEAQFQKLNEEKSKREAELRALERTIREIESEVTIKIYYSSYIILELVKHP